MHTSAGRYYRDLTNLQGPAKQTAAAAVYVILSDTCSEAQLQSTPQQGTIEMLGNPSSSNGSQKPNQVTRALSARWPEENLSWPVRR